MYVMPDEPIPDTQPRPTTSTRFYLGDGAYADLDGDAIVLTTHNGVEVTNTVVLEPETLTNLLRFIGGCATPTLSTRTGKTVVRESLSATVIELRDRAKAAKAAYKGPALSLDMAYLARAYHVAAVVLDGALGKADAS